MRRPVERVLGDHPGLTAPEIAGRAAGKAERSVKPASIRSELSNGLAQRRYRSDNGRWSLAGASGEDGTLQAAAAPGGEDATAARVDEPSETAAGATKDGDRLGLSR